MGQDENLSIPFESEEWEYPTAGELGTLLRREREKRGLSLEQLSERIRVRPQFLDAMENEHWDRLPSYGFVKGFMRAYAQALGLDPERILSLYETLAFPQDVSARPVSPGGRGKKRPFIVTLVVLLILLLVAGGVYYIWKIDVPWPFRGAHKGPAKPTETENMSQEQAEEAGGIAKEKPVAQTQEQTPLQTVAETASPRQEEPAAAASQDVPPPEADAPPQTETAVSPDMPETDTKITPDTGPVKAPEKEKATQNGSQHVLKGIVKERTWVRIFIDGQDPKESVFTPGSRPEWEAQDGFELLIGNAGGIDFEFNGEHMTNLGKSGQVIRLFFPEDFKRRRIRDEGN